MRTDVFHVGEVEIAMERYARVFCRSFSMYGAVRLRRDDMPFFGSVNEIFNAPLMCVAIYCPLREFRRYDFKDSG